MADQSNHDHSHDHDHDHDHDHGTGYFWPSVSFLLLLLGLALEHYFKPDFFKGHVPMVFYLLAYLPVALPVLKEALHLIQHRSFFNEFFLMGIATIGAFAIGEYPEGVAVMLFYTIGELFQMKAVSRAKDNIKALLDVRPNIASVFRKGSFTTVHPETVTIGEKIQVKTGEKVPLDGILISKNAHINNASLTGESRIQMTQQGEAILAGSINIEHLIELKVSKIFEDSSISKILELVQNASSRKSKTELLIRRLAKIYTPIVVYLAIAIIILPWFFTTGYEFSKWLYRALVFLVISCPCALVISIPLGYFGGLGAASKNGILFKGASYLDQLTKVTTLVMDKTGTLTKGVFKIKEINTLAWISTIDFMSYLIAVEQKSNHPIAKAIVQYEGEVADKQVKDLQEIAGMGIKAKVDEKDILVGNKKLLTKFGIELSHGLVEPEETTVFMAINQRFAGHLTIADELKSDAADLVNPLKKMGIKTLAILSGDKDGITKKVAKGLGIAHAKGDLLPEDKLREVGILNQTKTGLLAFIGDGNNDAPVLAASDIGIAMGGLGSDVAIETADVVIQSDQPSKVITAIKIAKATQGIIWQNITLAFGIKIIVLIMGALGMATMWAAVFADVGVALLAILNAVRLQHMKF